MKTSIAYCLVLVTGAVTLLGACAQDTNRRPNFGEATNSNYSAKEQALQPSGTQVVVCRDDKNVIKSVELIDLTEAKKQPLASTSDLSTQVAHLLDAAVFGIGDRGEGYAAIHAQLSQTAARLLDPNQTQRLRGTNANLPLIKDTIELQLPANCQAEQLIQTQTNTDTTAPVSSMNADLFDQMSVAQQAAAILHESLFSFLHALGEPDSSRVRPMVAFVSAGGAFTSITDRLSASYVECLSPANDAGGISRVLISQNAGDTADITVESMLGSQRLNSQATPANQKISDYVTDAPCAGLNLIRTPVLPAIESVGRLDRGAIVNRVCHLGQVSVYVASGQTSLIAEVRSKKAQKLTCVLKTRP